MRGSRPAGRPRSITALVNGNDVRDTWFYLPPGPVLGYDPRQVDDLLRRVAAELDAGYSARPTVENATLGLWPGGYDIDAVDWFLGQFVLPPDHLELAGISDDPWGDLPVAQLAPGGVSDGVSRWNFFRQCEQAWRDFGQLPGTRLWFGKAAKGLTELRTAEQQTLAFLRGSGARPLARVGGVSLTSNGPFGKLSLPGKHGVTKRSSAPGTHSVMRRESPPCTSVHSAPTGALALVSSSLISGSSGFWSGLRRRTPL